MAELSPYKLFPEKLRERNFWYTHGSYTSANLSTDRIDMTVPAQQVAHLSYCSDCRTGGPNKQEFWFRRMQLKFILDEPLLNLSEIRIKLHDKFVYTVRGRSPIFLLELSERMLQLISLLRIHPDFQTWFEGQDSTCHDSTLITWRMASQYVNGCRNNGRREFCRGIRNSEENIWLARKAYHQKT